MVEALVASLILAVAALGTAGLTTASARAIAGSRLESTRAAAATQKTEQLLSLAWAVDPATPGSAIVDATSDLSVEPTRAGGSGLGAVPAGSLDANVAGFADYLDADGRWLADGSVRPNDAVTLRRWRLAPVPAAGGAAVAIQVFATSAAVPGVPAAGRRTGDVLITTIRTRKAF